jgi:hypothetical protein
MLNISIFVNSNYITHCFTCNRTSRFKGGLYRDQIPWCSWNNTFISFSFHFMSRVHILAFCTMTLGPMMCEIWTFWRSCLERNNNFYWHPRWSTGVQVDVYIFIFCWGYFLSMIIQHLWMGTERFFYLVVLNLNDGNLLFSTSRKGWVAFGKIKCCEDLSGIEIKNGQSHRICFWTSLPVRCHRLYPLVTVVNISIKGLLWLFWMFIIISGNW